MKTTVIAAKGEEFPCLKKFKGDGAEGLNDISPFVVLFSGRSTGVVIHAEAPPRFVGEFCEFWRADQFIPFNGKITLEN